jgi:AcrR family transcriptional regulator
VTRDQLAADQRERIIRAGAALIAKRGYHGTSIELIIRRAKVGYSTFYKNFADKEALFLGIFDFAGAVVREALTEVVEAEDGSWPDKVAAALRRVYELIQEDPVIARVCLVESLSVGPAGSKRYMQAVERFNPLLLPLRSERPGGDKLPETLESTLVGALLWTAYQRLIVGEADQLIRNLPEMIELVLSPYIGEAAAVDVAERHRAVPAADRA